MKTPNSVSQKIKILLKTNTKDFLKSWPTEKYEHEKYEHVQHSILSWGSFCPNYCSNAAWHGVDQPVALLRCYYPDAAFIITGDFNKANFRTIAPKYFQHVTINTRGDRTLDHCYSPFRDAYKSLLLIGRN